MMISMESIFEPQKGQNVAYKIMESLVFSLAVVDNLLIKAEGRKEKA